MEVGYLEYPAIPGVAAQQLIKTVAATGTPEAISATPLRVRYATIIGRKAAQTDNTGVVRVGPVSGNGNQAFDIQPGLPSAALDSILAGGMVDLSQWYIDVANAGDGVLVIYDR